MRTFDLSIEAGGTRGTESVVGSQAFAGGTKGMKSDGSIQGCFGAGGIPVCENRVVVRLSHADGKGKRGQGVLGKGFGDMVGHFFTELNQAQAGAAIDGGILIEATAFDPIGDEFDIDLDQIAWARDNEAAAVAFGVGFASASQTLAFNDFGNGRGRGKMFKAMVLEQLKETSGSEASFLANLQDPSAQAPFH